jgi:hypothetical protein
MVSFHQLSCSDWAWHVGRRWFWKLLGRCSRRWRQTRGSWLRLAHQVPGRLRCYTPTVEALEPRCLMATNITAAFGAGTGGGPQVTVVFNDGTQMSFFAFDPGFNGGVSVALGQVNGNAIPDVVVAAGRGGGPEVKVFDGAMLVAGQVDVTADFLAFNPTYTGGLSLATGRINGTTHDDVVVAAGTRIRVFDGADLQKGQAVPTADFFALNPAFQGRMSIAVGRVNDTQNADIVVAVGAGGGPEVKVFGGTYLQMGHAVATADFFAFDPTFAGGVSLALGRVNGTQNADVVVGAGSGGGPEVKVFDGADLEKGLVVATADFFAFDPAFTGGVTVATGMINGTGHADVIVGAGPGGGPEVKIFDGASLAQGKVVVTADFLAFNPAFTGGAQVVATPLNQNGRNGLIVLPGPGGGPQVLVFTSTQLIVNVYSPIYTFYAFPVFFAGGFAGYDCFFGTQGFTGGTESFTPAGTAGYTPPAGTGGGFTPGGFTPGGDDTGGGFTGGDIGGGFTGGGDTGGGDAGGGDTGGGVSLRAAAASLGVGRQAPGTGTYLAPGMVSLAGASVTTNPPAGMPGSLLPTTELLSVIQQAISWWDAAGIDAAQDQKLRSVEFQIVNLGGDTLGRTTDGIIHLSPTAAGYDWFADPSGDDFENPTSIGLAATPGTSAASHMDLATVIAHEMGLVLGLKETNTPGDIMAPFLPAGVRRLPTAQDVDALFAQTASFH